MCMGGPSGGSSGAADAQAQAASDEAAREGRINTGMSQINNMFSSYDDSYYGNLGTQYSNYFTPQVDSQYSDAKNKLLYAQANQGTVGSSAAQFANDQLAKEYAQDQTNVASGANDYENSAKADVAGVRSNLVAQLQSSADPSSITPDALNQIQVENVNSMTPLTGLFNDLTSQYGNYSAANNLTGGTNVINQSLSNLFGKGQTTGLSGTSKYVTS